MPTFIYDSSPALIAALLLATGLAFAFACVVVVRRCVHPDTRRRHAELAGVTVANAALLHSVLLAFLTIAVWEEFRDASESTGREAAAIRALHSHVRALPVGERDDLTRLVIEHVRSIVDHEWPAQAAGRPIPAMTSQLTLMRQRIGTLDGRPGAPRSTIDDLRAALDAVQDGRAIRLGERGGKVPGLIWTLIALLGFLTLALGAVLPAERVAMQMAMLGGTATAITIVVLMIVELDHPFRGPVSIAPTAYQAAFLEINR